MAKTITVCMQELWTSLITFAATEMTAWLASEGVTLTGTVTVTSGTGTPEGVVTSGVGSLFLRSDGGAGTTLYVKEAGTGNTGWAATT